MTLELFTAGPSPQPGESGSPVRVTLGPSLSLPATQDAAWYRADLEGESRSVEREWQRILREHERSTGPHGRAWSTELARLAWQAREEYLRSGGRPLSWEEILAEVRARRGDG